MNERKLTKSELAKREDIIMNMKKNKRSLVQKYGKDAEAVMYGRATNLAKTKAESMDQDRLKEMIKDALQNPKAADLNKDGKLSDYEEKRGAAIEKSMANELMEDEDLSEGASTEEKRIAMRAIKSIAKYRGVSNDEARNDLVRAAKEIGDLKEDLDLGHQDDEPHMLKADLYRIGKYAMELYQMVDRFEEGSEEVDFPHWWQSKIIKAKDMLVGAKHYLDFEIKEPQIDAMVDVAQDVEAIDENALGMTDSRLSSDQHIELDYAVRDDSAYTFGNDPYADDQLRYKYAKKMGFLEETVNEGTWALGSVNDIKAAIQTMEMGLDMDDSELEQHLQDNDAYFYNVLGDDELHDPLSRAYDLAAMGNLDRAHNELSDAIGRAEELLVFVQKREGLNEEDPGEADMVASDIQKAMNKHKKDDVKMYQLQKARTAMNKGDLEKAKKIAARLAEKLKSK